MSGKNVITSKNLFQEKKEIEDRIEELVENGKVKDKKTLVEWEIELLKIRALAKINSNLNNRID